MPLPPLDMTTPLARISTVFAGAVAHPDELGCGHCFSDDELALLHVADVPLPVELVRRVAEKEPSHWDDQPAVVRRILPQLAALLALGDERDGVIDPAWSARSLAAARWHTWPDDEKRAIEDFLAAWWRRTLLSAAAAHEVSTVFESCAIASITVEPWLDAWDEEAAHSSTVRAQRAQCVEDWRENLDLFGSPFFGWWAADEREQSAVETLRTWMLALPDPT